MKQIGEHNSAYGADKFGLKDLKSVSWNLGAPALYEHALAHGEAQLTADGALVAETGVHTGRSPKDKFTVKDATTENTVTAKPPASAKSCWCRTAAVSSNRLATTRAAVPQSTAVLARRCSRQASQTLTTSTSAVIQAPYPSIRDPSTNSEAEPRPFARYTGIA